MTRRKPSYDAAFDPPAPVVALRVGAPGSPASVVLSALVDTGADGTVVPAALARRLRLPLVDRIVVEGVGGRRVSVGVHAASVQLSGVRCVARVVALGSEALVGRDLLSRLVAHLDGPALEAELRAPKRSFTPRRSAIG